MKRTFVALATVSAAAALATILPAAIHARSRPQQLFVTVLDRTGTPVRDLTAGDFEISEAGKRREVTRAGLAKGLRERIAVLVDNGFMTGSTITPVRSALESLMAGVPEDDEFVLGTLSPEFRVKVKPTADRRELLAGVNMLFANTTSGTALIDGIVEVDDRFLKNTRDRWPVFVIITSDSPETSGRQIEEFNRRIQELVQRGARAHAIVVSYSTKARGNEPELCMALTQSTGGTFDPIAALTSLPDKLKGIAARIANARLRAEDEYLVEFARESETAPIEVSVPVPGVTVRVSLAP